MTWHAGMSIWMIIALTVITFTTSSIAVADGDNDKQGEVQQQKIITTPATTEQRLKDADRESGVNYEDEDDDDNDDEDDENDSDNKDEDEYEDELRDIAESHEAMSRDEKTNSTDNLGHSNANVSPGSVLSAKNFDSREKSVEESSDESMTSNEAISAETKLSTEVEELINFKRQTRSMMKRVPTVKKELNTQKEIQGNETMFDILAETLGSLEGKNVVKTRGLIDNNSRRPSGDGTYGREEGGGEYVDSDVPTQSLGKLNKRWQSDLKGFGTHLPSTHPLELEKLQKLKLRTEEYALVENLMELLVKLAENPKRWERAHELLKDMEDDLIYTRALDSEKRDNNNFLEQPSNSNTLSVLEKLKSTAEKPKKKKKKKKKVRNQLAMTTEISSTPTIPTTSLTETTTFPWKIYPDRFLGSLWLDSDQRKPSNLAKIHYAVSAKQQKSMTPNHRDENSGYLNDQVPAARDSLRKYPLSRKFHFGKINTHEKGSPLDQHDSKTSVYGVDTTGSSPNSRLLYYQLPKPTYLRSRSRDDRYDQYNQYSGEVRDDGLNDYQDSLNYPRNKFLNHWGFFNKPHKYSRYNLSPPMSSDYEDDRSNWGTRYRPWQSFWRPIFELEDENDTEGRMYGKFNSWSAEKNMEMPPWNLVDESSRSKGYGRDVVVADKNRNHSELSEVLKSKQIEENVVLPKITMKTWNSLTSDPATWPFKLSSAKPWPKDKNGKSYNPNADLVRKLGLDKQEQLIDKDDNKGEMKTGNEIEPVKEDNHHWSNDRKVWPVEMSPKIQSVGGWVMPADQSTWTPYETKQRQSFQHAGTSRWQERPDNAWQGKLTDWNSEFSKQPSHSATWPPKWKQFSYHKVNAGPISKPGSLEGTARTRNAFIAVSAVSPSKYPSNKWKNDVEDTSADDSTRHIDQDDPTSQLLHGNSKSLINQWNEYKTNSDRRNETDPLEYQLEELRENNLEKRSPPTEATYLVSATLNTTASTRASGDEENQLPQKKIEKENTLKKYVKQ
ncbi:uncharacterized protein [Chelonus insularis]|uniref:uncharacterized protein isoform X2 n=1 Tax=Chelonus insularis TaxID=460826 RepID=UPI00158B9E65|nr:uncharacterized protein LOC118069994 isoform X2 [Chelonus insularis]